MYTYFLNWMGPVNKKWIDEHGSDWMCGRIDIDGPDLPYGEEIAVRPMSSNSWRIFGDWLDELRTDTILSSQQLGVRFFKETGHRIKWLNNE